MQLYVIIIEFPATDVRILGVILAACPKGPKGEKLGGTGNEADIWMLDYILSLLSDAPELAKATVITLVRDCPDLSA